MGVYPEELTPVSLGRAYGVPVLEYRASGEDLLVAVGSGLMMATCDAIPSVRWCVDVGGGREYPGLAPWLEASAYLCRFVIVHAWFSISRPQALVRALRAVDAKKLLWTSNVDLGRGQRFHNFRALVEHLHNLEGNSLIDGVFAV